MRLWVLVAAVAPACEFSSKDLPPSNSDTPDAPPPDARAPDAAEPDAPPGFTCPASYDQKFGGHSYRLTTTPRTWAEAQAECAQDGGHLLKIESRAEDDEAAARILFDPATIWIGLRDTAQNGLYIWADGSEPTYQNYNGAAPTAASPDCIQKSTNDLDGTWYTLDCATPRRAICECDGP